MAGQRHALVIGVSEYERVPTLKYADKDAQDVAEALRLVGFEDENLTVLHGGDPDAQPHRSAVFHHLARIKSLTLEPDDVVLFYFSGHGMMSDDVDYLLPIEASDLALEDTAVSVDDVVRRLHQTGSRQVVMFIDACRNEMPTGKGIHGIGANTKSVVDQFDEGLAVVFSCSSRERSFEIDADDIKQSSFTHCLLEAIKDPKVNTINEIAGHLEREVKVLNGKHQLKPQVPYLLVKPDTLRELAIFALLEGGAARVDVDAYIEFLSTLRGQERLGPSVYWDVTAFLTEAAEDAIRMSLIRDLFEEQCSPEQFQQIWPRLRSRAVPQRTTPSSLDSVGERQPFSEPHGDTDDA